MMHPGKVGILYKHINKRANEWASAAADPRIKGKSEKKDDDKKSRCKFFDQGRCTKGRKCEFRHVQAHNAQKGKGDGGKGGGGQGAGKGGKNGGKAHGGAPPPKGGGKGKGKGKGGKDGGKNTGPPSPQFAVPRITGRTNAHEIPRISSRCRRTRQPPPPPPRQLRPRPTSPTRRRHSMSFGER